MKILAFILLIMTNGNVISQNLINSIDHYIKKEIQKGFRKELQIELNEVFNEIYRKTKTEQELQEKWYIIRGLDIQNRNAYGRVWTSNIKVHYCAKSNFELKKSFTRSVITSLNDSSNVTSNFDSLIKEVENGDFDFIKKYAKEKSVESGVFWWIIRIKKVGKKYVFEDYQIDDFDRL